MNDYKKVEVIKDLIEKSAFVGAAASALGKGVLGAGKTLASNPGTALTVGFSGMEAGTSGLSSARRASSTVVGAPPPGNM